MTGGVASTLLMWEMLKDASRRIGELAAEVASALPMWEMLNLLEKLKEAVDCKLNPKIKNKDACLARSVFLTLIL